MIVIFNCYYQLVCSWSGFDLPRMKDKPKLNMILVIVTSVEKV